MDEREIVEELECLTIRQNYLKYKDHWTEADYDKNNQYTRRINELRQMLNQ